MVFRLTISNAPPVSKLRNSLTEQLFRVSQLHKDQSVMNQLGQTAGDVESKTSRKRVSS